MDPDHTEPVASSSLRRLVSVSGLLGGSPLEPERASSSHGLRLKSSPIYFIWSVVVQLFSALGPLAAAALVLHLNGLPAQDAVFTSTNAT